MVDDGPDLGGHGRDGRPDGGDRQNAGLDPGHDFDQGAIPYRSRHDEAGQHRQAKPGNHQIAHRLAIVERDPPSHLRRDRPSAHPELPQGHIGQMRIADHLMVVQVGQRRRRPVAGEIGRRRDDNLPVLAELAGLQRAVACFADADTDIETVARQVMGAVVIVDAQVQLRMRGGEPREDRGQIHCAEAHRRGDGKRPAQGRRAVHAPGRAFGCRDQFGQCRSQALRQVSRCLGRRDPPGVAAKKRCSHRRLEIRDPLADHRFRQVHPSGGRRDGAQFHHRQEGLDLVQGISHG